MKWQIFLRLYRRFPFNFPGKNLRCCSAVNLETQGEFGARGDNPAGTHLLRSRPLTALPFRSEQQGKSIPAPLLRLQETNIRDILKLNFHRLFGRSSRQGTLPPGDRQYRHFWSAEISQTYPTLKRLEQRSLPRIWFEVSPKGANRNVAPLKAAAGLLSRNCNRTKQELNPALSQMQGK